MPYGWLKIFARETTAVYHMLKKFDGMRVFDCKVCFLIALDKQR